MAEGEAKEVRTGRCLCGTVSFALPLAKREVEVCHCEMCRRWKGGPLFSFGFDGDPAIEGADNVGVYKSSAWAERAFCKTCGSYLYWHLAGSDHYAFSAGLLDDQTGLNFTTEIFIDEKPAYYDFANDTKKQTGAEVMAAFEAGKTE